MHFHVAEVAPAAPALVEALPPLIILSGLLVALGLIMLIDGFVRALFGAVASLFSSIPFVGGLTSSAIHNAEHAISNSLGNAISGIEKRIAHQFQNLAGVVLHFWHLFERSAENVYDLARLLAGVATFPDVAALQRQLRHLVAAAEHTAAVAIAHALHNAKAATRSVAEGVYPRLRHLEHEVTRTLPREIKRTRDLAREAEDGVARLWKAVRALPTAADVTAAVAAAIAALGLAAIDWIKCENMGALGREVCGLEKGLMGDFLAAFLAAEAVVNFRELVQLAQTVEHGVAEGIRELVEL